MDVNELLAKVNLPVVREAKPREAKDYDNAFRRLIEYFQPFGHATHGPYYYAPVNKMEVVAMAEIVDRRATGDTRPLLDALVDDGRRREKSDAAGRPHRVQALLASQGVWVGDRKFGEYLRDLRKEAGLSFREAAAKVGTSHVEVARLEKHVWKRRPAQRVLERVATAYGKDLREVMEKAGFQFPIAPDVALGVDIHAMFRRLVVDLEVRPAGMWVQDIGRYAGWQKQQVFDLLTKVDEHRRKGGRPLANILSRDLEPGAS